MVISEKATQETISILEAGPASVQKALHEDKIPQKLFRALEVAVQKLLDFGYDLTPEFKMPELETLSAGKAVAHLVVVELAKNILMQIMVQAEKSTTTNELGSLLEDLKKIESE